MTKRVPIRKAIVYVIFMHSKYWFVRLLRISQIKFHQICNVYFTIFVLPAVDLLVDPSKLIFQNNSFLAR